MNFSVRFHTMATVLAVAVLGCTRTTEERAGLLHKMIQIAAELKSTMGNMFGFASIMRALELPQVHSWKHSSYADAALKTCDFISDLCT